MAQDSATGKTENLFLLSLDSFSEPFLVKDLTGLVSVLLFGGTDSIFLLTWTCLRRLRRGTRIKLC